MSKEADNDKAKKTAAVKKKKVAAKKAVTKKKTVTKKTVAKKKAAVTKQAPAKKKTASPKKTAVQSINPRERYEMIAKMAYFRAEKRNFAPGLEQQDWFECEKIIDEMMSKKST